MEILSQSNAIGYIWNLTQSGVQDCSKQTPKCSGGLPGSKLTPELWLGQKVFSLSFVKSSISTPRQRSLSVIRNANHEIRENVHPLLYILGNKSRTYIRKILSNITAPNLWAHVQCPGKRVLGDRGSHGYQSSCAARAAVASAVQDRCPLWLQDLKLASSQVMSNYSLFTAIQFLTVLLDFTKGSCEI